jgi:o-succinylbenzoate synthase
VGFGEIAPLEAFGSESIERALWLLRGYCGLLRPEYVTALDPREFPCTAYALRCAIADTMGRTHGTDGLWIGTAALLHARDLDGRVSNHLQDLPEPVIKLKVGGSGMAEDGELACVKALVDECRAGGKRLRLDANEQFSQDQARRWLEVLGADGDVIEFLEQPLERLYLEELMELARGSPLRIALDESVQLLQGQEPGYVDVDLFDWVIKPGLGDLHWAERHGIPAERRVISSVFETAIGFEQLLRMGPFPRVAGLDTQGVFDDGLSYPKALGGFVAGLDRADKVWQQLE